jgi:hypothetical protein
VGGGRYHGHLPLAQTEPIARDTTRRETRTPTNQTNKQTNETNTPTPQRAHAFVPQQTPHSCSDANRRGRGMAGPPSRTRTCSCASRANPSRTSPAQWIAHVTHTRAEGCKREGTRAHTGKTAEWTRARTHTG